MLGYRRVGHPGGNDEEIGQSWPVCFPPPLPAPVSFLVLSLFSCVPELCSFAVAGFGVEAAFGRR